MTSSLGEERLAQLRQAKLAAIVARAFPDDGELAAGSFPDGATAVGAAGVASVLVEAPGPRSLGPVLLWSLRSGVDRVRFLLGTDDPGPQVTRAPEPLGPRLARQAARWATPVVEVWALEGPDPRRVDPGPVPAERTPSGEALALGDVFREAGLEVVVEHGVVRGEVLGLEVARVVEAPGTAAVIEVGIGKFDREMSAMMHAGTAPATAVANAAALVRRHRAPGLPTHPLRDLVPERWVRRRVLDEPSLVGAAALAPIGTTLEPSSLRERQPAAAVGTTTAGEPLVVVSSAGVDPDLVPLAADTRDRVDPAARLVLVVGGSALPASAALLAERLSRPAEVVTIAAPWSA